jgi:hypothetical protein
MATTQNLVIDINKLLTQRNKLRGIEDSIGEVSRLEAIRSKQKAWNYKRGALLRKYNKILKDPDITDVRRKVIERDISQMPRYNLASVDNEISRLKNEDYIVTVKWKGGNTQIMASELLSKDNPALFILENIKETKENINFGEHKESKIKLLSQIEFNMNAVINGEYGSPDGESDTPIMFEFVGDYIIVNI